MVKTPSAARRIKPLITAAPARAATSISRGSCATAELDCRLRHDFKPLLAESFVEAGHVRDGPP